MVKLKWKELVRVISGNLYGDQSGGDPVIQHLAIDSRTIADYHSSLFFALKGIRHNGHHYIADLYRRGVRYFVVSEKVDYTAFEEARFIQVDDSLAALQQVAAAVRAKFSYPVLAISGSNGKTIVKEWLYDLLHESLKIIRSPKSYNSQVGVPLSVWNMSDQFELALFEAGISLPGEMEKLAQVIQPSIGIFTNLGEAHQENFESKQAKLQEKLKLFQACDLLIYRNDQDLINEALTNHESYSKKRLFAWTMEQTAGADLEIAVMSQGNSSTISFSWDDEAYSVAVPFADSASLENIGHCLAFIVAGGYLSPDVLQKFSSLHAVAMRLELKQGINDCLLINDYYNSDINSLAIALQFLKNQSTNGTQKRTLILSDIEQSGFSIEELASEVKRLADLFELNRLIAIGPNLSGQQSILGTDAEFYSSTEDFLNEFRPANFQQEHILIKGAREFRFERIAAVLQRKYHQTQLEINLNALVENLNRYKSLLKPETKIVVMVKAFSYGSGTVEIARTLEFQKVDYLAVAVADEGIELRQAGINTPIMVMNPEEHSFEMMLEYRLEPNVYSTELFEKFDRVAKQMAVTDFPIHLKLETGMHRLGFSSVDELLAISQRVESGNRLRIQSLFSHLAASDSPNHDEFTQLQYKRFQQLAKPVVDQQKGRVLRHLLNSAGIERFPAFQMEMVRLGIGLYGISQSDAIEAETVARWTTVVSQVKTVKAGETVGYGRKGIVDGDRTIAIIPVGYADGYDRRLSNGAGKVWIDGRPYPVIGNICMDMTMIDITGANVEAGEQVELMGEHIQLTDLADWMGTIPYEVLTGISQRVRRVYVQE